MYVLMELYPWGRGTKSRAITISLSPQCGVNYNWALRNEMSRQNQQNCMCAQRRLRSAWASSQPDQSLLCAQWVAKDPSFLQADIKDSEQTGQMPWLNWVFAGRMCHFAGRTCHFVGFVMKRLKWYYPCSSPLETVVTNDWCIMSSTDLGYSNWAPTRENLSSGLQTG